MCTRPHRSFSLDADALLSHVEALAPDAWLAIGAGAPRDDASFATALLIRDAALSDRSLDVEAWMVRDAVDTLAWLAARRLGTLDRRQRARLTLARERIERLAVTRLVADALDPRDLRALGAATIGWLPALDVAARPLRGPAEEAGLDAG